MRTRKEIVGENIKGKREKKTLTQKDFARLLNISNVTLSTYESGRTMPKPAIIERMCEILGCRKEELLGLNYDGSVKDRQKRMLDEIFDNLSEDSRHLLLVRAKELERYDKDIYSYKRKIS
ncbi:helix-turn-helix domain-containing protein [Pseudobutyrivibrio sp. LB2011]|uniref:helix-turn-helix domain-containing protein n=1 Tax=Pseudobutyrivibrio sp. LB2011 TaxID=1408312 RepID=UPI0005D21759|nr:helix-turn-helix transcriptional regulator [Pseudobutyrivibrio sp. LB2011]